MLYLNVGYWEIKFLFGEWYFWIDSLYLLKKKKLERLILDIILSRFECYFKFIFFERLKIVLFLIIF